MSRWSLGLSALNCVDRGHELKAFDKFIAAVLTTQRLERLGLVHKTDISDQQLQLLLTDDRLNLLNLRAKTEADDHADIPLIEFFCREEDWDVIPKPVPAYKRIPEWFRKIPAAHDGQEMPAAAGRHGCGLHHHQLCGYERYHVRRR